MKKNKGIGLFGGTFDPLHHGHIIVAEWLTEILELQKTIFIPTKIHPFNKRQGISPAPQRLEMLQNVLKSFDNFELSTFELDRETVSYAVDTIKYFKNKFPSQELYYFIGSDNLDSFLKWKDPFQILDLCYLAVYNRGHFDHEPDISSHPKVLLVESPLIEISSSHIRKRISKQMPFQSLVPHSVFEYITHNNLYQSKE